MVEQKRLGFCSVGSTEPNNPVPDFDSLSAGFDPNSPVPLDGALTPAGFDTKISPVVVVFEGVDPNRPVDPVVAGFF